MAAQLTVAVLALMSNLHTARAVPTFNDNYAVDRFPASVAKCVQYKIPIPVTATIGVLNITEFKNDFDVVDLVTRHSRKNLNNVIPSFIGGYRNISDTFTVSGTFCTPKNPSGNHEKTVVLATHGQNYDGRYWDSAYKPEQYSFVEGVVKHGFSVFYHDRLGTGKSQKISSYVNQGGIQVEIIRSLTALLRSGQYTGSVGKPNNIVLIGHSLGTYTTYGTLLKYPTIADGVILTGLSYRRLPWTFKMVLEIWAPRIASQLYPERYADLESGYVTFADKYAHVNAYFKAPFDAGAFEYAQSIVQPWPISEWLAPSYIANTTIPTFAGPVLVTAGEFDMNACTGECYSNFAEAATPEAIAQDGPAWRNSRMLETAVHPGAAHNLNFAPNATGHYDVIGSFLKRAGF